MQLGILIAWLGFTIAAFGYFIDDKLVSFDAHHKLKDVQHSALSDYLSHYLPGNSPNNMQTILHFSTPNCDCQQYSQDHIAEINILASDHNFEIKNITVTQDRLIPTTPSIALIDNTGHVFYFGPYGQGLACSQTAGYAQTMLNNYLKGFMANVIIKDAKGCYCEV